MHPVQTLHVPPTVQAMLAARIDRLAPEEKRLLQIAAVVGKDLPFALLQVITTSRGCTPSRSRPPPVRRVPLRDRTYPGIAYTFKHALTHEVTYERTAADRARASRAIVEAMETLHRDRPAETSSASPITPSGVSSGRRPCTISARPASGHETLGQSRGARLPRSRAGGCRPPAAQPGHSVGDARRRASPRARPQHDPGLRQP